MRSAVTLIALVVFCTTLHAQVLPVCPVDNRTGLDLETGTRFDWYAEVRYTYAILVGQIIDVNSFDSDALPKCSRPVLLSVQANEIWRREIAG